LKNSSQKLCETPENPHKIVGKRLRGKNFPDKSEEEGIPKEMQYRIQSLLNLLARAKIDAEAQTSYYAELLKQKDCLITEQGRIIKTLEERLAAEERQNYELRAVHANQMATIVGAL
jgi:hypothetical protein